MDTSDSFTFNIVIGPPGKGAIWPSLDQMETDIVDVLPSARLDPVDEIAIVFSEPEGDPHD